jgi:ApbE superfamily uncharacterized protein (UPF0280 family)
MEVLEPRTYRAFTAAEGLEGFRIVLEETDLHIQTDRPCDELRELAWQEARTARQAIRTEITLRPEFLTSLSPLEPREGVAQIVREMYDAGLRAGVGPMAAVAGAVAQQVGRALLQKAQEVIVENGGDNFLSLKRTRTAAVYAGRSPLSMKVGLIVPAGTVVGMCTSSGTVGHSYSAGIADAALVAADDTAYADAMATALGNRVHGPEDVQGAVEWAMSQAGVRQALVICQDKLAVAGEFELTQL